VTVGETTLVVAEVDRRRITRLLVREDEDGSSGENR
jgi:hypothetical protein